MYSSKGALSATGALLVASAKSSDERASAPQCCTSVAACAGNATPHLVRRWTSASGSIASGM